MDEKALHEAHDAVENRNMPSLMLDPADPISIGEVTFLEPAAAMLVLTNTGEVAAKWNFAPKV